MENKTEQQVQTARDKSGHSQEPVPERKYAILQEVNEEEGETWLYFILYNGNEEALKHLNKQLETVRWRLEDGMSTFDLELEFLVCERTAKEMTKVDLNHYSFHRKFDGVLKKIDLGLKDGQSNSKKMKKVNDILAYGDIDKFVGEEDIDPEDLNGSGVSSSSESGSGDEEDDEESAESKEEEETDRKHKKHGKLPGTSSEKTEKKKIEIPRFAKAKKHHK